MEERAYWFAAEEGWSTGRSARKKIGRLGVAGRGNLAAIAVDCERRQFLGLGCCLERKRGI